MKCSKCNFENPDSAKYCQECGMKLEPQHKACTNKECRDFGKYILPLEAKFCPRCGKEIEGQKGSGKKEETNKANGKKKETNGYINGHEYVDLGLPSGLKWATCNVGANSPEEYGDYYAWGETYTKDEYDKDNCEFWEVEVEEGGNPNYDVATSEWGEEWRLPTKEEFEELVEECEWKWMKKKGVNGMRVTGPNGKSIFLPAAGNRDGSSLYYDGSDGHYWSSTPNDYGNYDNAYYLDFYIGSEYVDWDGNRNLGLTVRPVTE